MRDKDIRMKFESLNFYYGNTHALKNINLRIYKNKVTAIIGP